MSFSLAPDEDAISSFFKQARAGADTSPPTYSGPQDDLPKYELGPGQNPAVAPDQMVMDVISDAVSSPAGKNALRKAIDELGDSAFSIEVCFTNVAHGLVNALVVASTQAQQEDILRFQGEWDHYRKMYIDLLWSSRVVAGHARTTAKGWGFSQASSRIDTAIDFAKDFIGLLKDEGISLQDKKEEIQGYREQLAEDIQNSQNLSQGFLDLQTSVTEFQERVTVWLQAREQIQQQIEHLLHDIETTNQAIKKLTSLMLMGAASSLALGGVAAGAFAIGILCPLLWVGAVGAAFFSLKKGMDVLQQMQVRKAQLASLEGKKAELERLQVALSGMQRVYTILDPLQSDMVLIREKLGVFSQIWSFIRADLVEIEKSMEMATTAKTKFLFKRRLETIEQIYSALCDALYQYETRVHTQPVFAVYK